MQVAQIGSGYHGNRLKYPDTIIVAIDYIDIPLAIQCDTPRGRKLSILGAKASPSSDEATLGIKHLNATVLKGNVPVSHIEIPLGVCCNTLKFNKLSIHTAARPPLGDEVTLRIKLLDTRVTKISHIHVPLIIYCNVSWVAELPIARAGASPLGGKVALGIKLQNAICTCVRNIDVLLAIYRNALRLGYIRRGCFGWAQLGNEVALGIKLLDAVYISRPNISLGVHCKTSKVRKLSIHTAAGPPLRDEVVRGIKLLDTIVTSISHIYVPLIIYYNPSGVAELPITSARASPFGLKLECRSSDFLATPRGGWGTGQGHQQH